MHFGEISGCSESANSLQLLERDQLLLGLEDASLVAAVDDDARVLALSGENESLGSLVLSKAGNLGQDGLADVKLRLLDGGDGNAVPGSARDDSQVLRGQAAVREVRALGGGNAGREFLGSRGGEGDGGQSEECDEDLHFLSGKITILIWPLF